MWRALFRDAGGWIELRRVPEHGAPRFQAEQRWYQIGAASRYDAALRFLEDRDGRGCLAYGLHPRTHRGAMRADQVLAAHALVVDLDVDGEAGRAAARAQLDAFGLQPSAIVDSGHGWHAYWFLNAAARLLGDEAAGTRQRLTQLGRRLTHALGGDHVWDLARVLRIPGTANLKPGRPDARARVVDVDGERRYELADLEAAAPPLPSPEPRPGALYAPIRPPAGKHWPLTPYIEDVIRTGRSPRLASRSHAEFAVCCAMLRAGYTRDEILQTFLANPDGIGQRTVHEGERHFDYVFEDAAQRYDQR